MGRTGGRVMTVPTIHLNGTSGERLADAYASAAAAIEVALEALRETAPNGRDYYPQGPDAMESAIREYQARDRALRAMMDDLASLAVHCRDATR